MPKAAFLVKGVPTSHWLKHYPTHETLQQHSGNENIENTFYAT